MPLDVLLDALRGAPHVHGQRRDRYRRDQSQRSFPQRLIARALEQIRSHDAQKNRKRDAPAHRRDELVSSTLSKVGKTDGDDEKGLETFPKSDDKCWQHDGDLPRISWKIEESALNRDPISKCPTSLLPHIRPVKSVIPSQIPAACDKL